MVKLLAIFILIYMVLMMLFFWEELFYGEKQSFEKMLRAACKKTNHFFKNFFKDLFKNEVSVPSQPVLAEMPPILASELFREMGIKFSKYNYLEQMKFSKIDKMNGFYCFSFQIINENLNLSSCIIKDVTEETVKNYLFASGASIVDTKVELCKLTDNIARVVVSCANDPNSYAALQNYKRRLVDLDLKKKIDSLNTAVDEELNQDLDKIEE